MNPCSNLYCQNNLMHVGCSDSTPIWPELANQIFVLKINFHTFKYIARFDISLDSIYNIIYNLQWEVYMGNVQLNKITPHRSATDIVSTGTISSCLYQSNPMVTMKKTYFIIVLLFLIFVGCAHMQIQQRKRELEAALNPLLGKSKEMVVLSIGLPVHIDTIGQLEAYQYYRRYGTRSNVWISPNEYFIYGGAQSWEAYDKVNVYFKDGIMIKWDAYIQR